MKKRHKTNIRQTKKNRQPYKGLGSLYVVMIMAILIGGALMMLGNISPNELGSSPSQQTVIIKKPTSEAAKNNLQLYNFPGVTYTPTPSLTPTPTLIPTLKPTGSGGGPLPQPGPGGGGCGNSCVE